MKRNDNKIDKELFFKNLASSYAEKSGGELKKELAVLNSSETLSLDRKVKSKIQSNKIKTWTSRLMPIAACLIILFISLNFFKMPGLYDSDNNNKSNSDNLQAPTVKYEKLDFEFISKKLPADYTLEKIDYDHQKTIYYIVSNKDTEIILTVEESPDNINPDGFDSMRINNINAYGKTTEDFSFIQYKKDNLLYILTGPDDYDDLIKISEYLI